jgi:hypothetical protein
MFAVDVDEPIAGGTLTLNGRSARLMKNIDGAYWAKWGGADANGRIDILYPDGGKASCGIGYVTNGMGIQRASIEKRVCSWTPTIDD